MHQSPTELEDVITRVQTMSTDVDAYYDHLVHGTLSLYYKQVIDVIVVDMMRLPIERVIQGLGPVENPDDVNFSMSTIAEILSTSFDRSQDQVRADIIEAVKACPADDIRSARFLQHTNRLH